jgi:hypothetical protein
MTIVKALQTVIQFLYLRLPFTSRNHRYIGSGPLRTWTAEWPAEVRSLCRLDIHVVNGALPAKLLGKFLVRFRC